MRVAIVKRFDRDGVTMRELACGHMQREHRGSEPSTVLEAQCVECSAAEVTVPGSHKARPTPALDARSELQRLADAVESVYVYPPGRAWSRSDVAVKKLVQAALKHACGVTQS